MILGVFIGICAGMALSAIWRAFLKLLFISKGDGTLLDKEPVVNIGPFLHKKSKGKRKPISHTDSEVFEREMRANGKML